MGALANVGVSTIIYKEDYHHDISKSIAEYAEIEIIKYKE